MAVSVLCGSMTYQRGRTDMTQHTVHITEIGGRPVSEHLPFTIRGRGKKKAKPTKCCECGDEIAVGEQYFWLMETRHVCLGCVKYS